jgi:hypothetical protein
MRMADYFHSGHVSVWVGTFPSEWEFRFYLRQQEFPEDGEQSIFSEELGLPVCPILPGRLTVAAFSGAGCQPNLSRLRSWCGRHPSSTTSASQCWPSAATEESNGAGCLSVCTALSSMAAGQPDHSRAAGSSTSARSCTMNEARTIDFSRPARSALSTRPWLSRAGC